MRSFLKVKFGRFKIISKKSIVIELTLSKVMKYN